MADKTVSLEVDVDVVGGESVEKLEKDLKDIEKELSKTKGGKKFDALNKQLTITKSKLDSVKKSVGTTKGAIDKVGVSTNTFKDGVDGASQSMAKLSNGAANSKELLTELSSQLIGATAIWGAVAIAIVEVGRALYEYATRLTQAEKQEKKFKEITEEVTDSMDAQIVQFDILFKRLESTNGASEERLGIINEINETFGTTLENLEDEAEYANQVALAYEKISKSLELKIELQILEEELLSIKKEERTLAKELEKSKEKEAELQIKINAELGKGVQIVQKYGTNIDRAAKSQTQLNDLQKETEGIQEKANFNDKTRIELLEGVTQKQKELNALKLASTDDEDKKTTTTKAIKEKTAKGSTELTREELAEMLAKESEVFFSEETKRLDGIQSIRDKFRLLLEDGEITTEAEKLKLEESRVLAELELLKATEEQKAEVMQYYSEQIKLAEIEDAEESAKARAAINRDLYNNVIDLAEQAFDQETSIGKAAFEVAKGLRVAQAIMDTIAASTSALKDVPYPYNLAAAASIAIQGGLNVKKILDTKIGGTASVGGNPTQTVQNPSSIQPQQTGFTDLRSQRIQIDPVKVYVLESDITNAQIGVQDTRLVSVIK